MKTEKLITKLTPGWIQRAVLKQWMPFGSGYETTLSGNGAPAWLKSDQESMITKGFMYNPDVYAIISYITSLASQIPWVLYEVKNEKWLNRYKNLDPLDTIKANLYERKGLDDLGDKNRVMDIWKRPNSLQGQAEFVEQLLGYRLAIGEAFVVGAGPESGPNKGQYQELDVLPSHLIDIKYGNAQEPVAHYFWRGDPSKKIDPALVMHTKYWNPLPYTQGGLHGMSPLQSAMRLVTRNNDSLTASVRSLQNMGAMGMMTRDPSAAGEQGLTPEQAEMVERAYYKKFGGADNRGKIMITGAVLKWQQMGMSPVDLQIIEQEKMDLRKLCNIYHLQSQLFNDPENKTYNNMREARQSAYTQAVIPVMRSIRDELNRWWIPGFEKSMGKQLWFDMDLQAIPELQTNMKELVEWLNQAQMLTLNEKRDVIEYERIEKPGMDEIWMEGSKVTPEQALMDTGAVDNYLAQGIEENIEE